jgi:probable H4MPT-linked C1 transfer pathway protein
MTGPPTIVGWDIGGVNTKAARLDVTGNAPVPPSVCLPYEIQRDPTGLIPTLTEVARLLGSEPADLHAVTMTAELSQAFRTKREGVAFVLDALEGALPGAGFQVYTVDGRFVRPAEARAHPLAVAAANWTATASFVSRSVPTCVLIDVGTTTSDLIPIVRGSLAVQGFTDPERLLSGELVYTGALRTPAEAVTSRVPLWGGSAGISADGFALIGDAHLWLGRLRPEDYTCRTPDGRAPSRESCGERLARTVCADRDMLDDSDIDAIATALAGAQVRSLVDSLQRIRQRCPEITRAVVTGLGDFIAVEAACTAGLNVTQLAEWLGPASRTAPAAAVAWLLWQSLESAG